MNIHEYQAKQILSRYQVAIPKGSVVYTPGEAKRMAQRISPHGPWMLKAQIQSGARSEGHFLEKNKGKAGGVRYLNGHKDVFEEAEKMLGSTLVTSQTGPKGKLVSKIYIEEHIQTLHDFYISLVIDRMVPCVTLLVAPQTSNILECSVSSPQQILRINSDPQKKISDERIDQILEFLNLDRALASSMKAFVDHLYRAFKELDMLMMEINPVGIDKNGRFVALDAKMSFDDHALYRHPEIRRLHDDYEDPDRVIRAARYGFQYAEFGEGTIGCIVNGDGLVLTAVDLLDHTPERVSCFLNVKGAVDKDKIAEGIKIIMSNPRVEGILMNILGGFLRCDLVADGIVSAASEVGLNVPLVVRMEGTNKKDAQEILQRSDLPVVMTETLEEGVELLLKAMEEN